VTIDSSGIKFRFYVILYKLVPDQRNVPSTDQDIIQVAQTFGGVNHGVVTWWM